MRKNSDMQNLAQQEKIFDTVKIPPQPEILGVIQEELQAEHPDIARISEKIMQDSGLYAAMLKLINSPYYGLRSEVTSIRHAITLLGVDNLSTSIASILFRIQLRDGNFIPMPRYWDSSTDVAKLAGYTSRRCGVCTPYEAYAFGLFRDVGIPLLAQKFENYKAVLAEQNLTPLQNYTDLEDQHFDTNHAVISYLLTRNWGLGDALREACLHHHDTEYIMCDDPAADQNPRRLIVVMKLAEHVANSRRQEPDYEWKKMKPFILEFLGLSEPDYLDLKKELLDHLDGVQDLT